MKPSHSNFELIPEEDQEQYYGEHNMDQVFKKEATAAAAAAAAAPPAPALRAVSIKRARPNYWIITSYLKTCWRVPL